MPSMIEAITFDFWDTIAIDDSDEPKRAALGLDPADPWRDFRPATWDEALETAVTFALTRFIVPEFYRGI